jgi:hypothetical protein
MILPTYASSGYILVNALKSALVVSSPDIAASNLAFSVCNSAFLYTKSPFSPLSSLLIGKMASLILFNLKK